MKLKVRMPTKKEWLRAGIASWVLSVTVALGGAGFIIHKQQQVMEGHMAAIEEVRGVAFTNALRVGMLGYGVKGALVAIIAEIEKHHPASPDADQEPQD